MLWELGQYNPTIVRDATGRHICTAASNELAEQIVKDHNNGDAALTEDQKDAIRTECAERRVPRV